MNCEQQLIAEAIAVLVVPDRRFVELSFRFSEKYESHGAL
jgi:hypothetical protein